jgi:DNA adenine methylase
MTRDDHIRLLETITQCKGNVSISGYFSTLYDSYLRDWNRVEWDIANHSGQTKTKQRRRECLWINYSADQKEGENLKLHSTALDYATPALSDVQASIRRSD